MDPITREEMYLAAAAGYDVEPPEPITRKEVFLAKLAGMDVETPVPFTRRERFIEEAAMAENNAVIEPLQVTENGTYTAPAGVDGYNPVIVDVKSEETNKIILNETHLTGFVSDPNYGGLFAKDYGFGYGVDFFELTEGQEYLVLWDDGMYSTIAKDASAVLPGALYLGNGSLMGLEGNGEPFAIGCTSQGVTFFGLTDPASEHTVAIIKRVRPENLMLQDIIVTENGKYTADKVYDGIGEVTVNVAGSGGGSLPPGLYLEQYEVPSALYAYPQRLFRLNGTLYSLVNPYYIDKVTNQFDLYKFTNGTWSKVNSSKYTLKLTYSNGRTGNNHVVEFNGKAHIFPSSSPAVHYIFDGQNSIVEHKTINSSASACPFIENGKLKVVLSSDKKVYVWDEATDTWTEDGTTLKSADVARYDGSIYYSEWKSPNYIFYKRKNGVETEICRSETAGSNTWYVVKNGYAYTYYTTQESNTLTEVNLSTGETKKYTFSYVTGASMYTLGDDDPILYRGGNFSYYTQFWANYALRIVRE